MCLMYVMNCIRLDIAYSVNKHSRFTSNLNMGHWKAIKRVLKYLRCTLNYVLHYFGYPIVLKWYSDANWISDTKDSKSTSRYVFTFCGTLVLWKSFKQTCIIRFTMKSEFIAFDKAGDEAKWIQNFLDDI
jgi:hypothetical protein